MMLTHHINHHNNYLLKINQGLIKEEIIKGNKAGRPKRVYSIVN